MNVSSSRWQFYVIPDLKTWSTHAAFQTPLEHFANPADAFARFKELRTAPYNHEPQDFHSNGEPYARLTLGMEQKERQRSLHLLLGERRSEYPGHGFFRSCIHKTGCGSASNGSAGSGGTGLRPRYDQRAGKRKRRLAQGHSSVRRMEQPVFYGNCACVLV